MRKTCRSTRITASRRLPIRAGIEATIVASVPVAPITSPSWSITIASVTPARLRRLTSADSIVERSPLATALRNPKSRASTAAELASERSRNVHSRS